MEDDNYETLHRSRPRWYQYWAGIVDEEGNLLIKDEVHHRNARSHLKR